MANKHTSLAGLVYVGCLVLKKIAPLWFPDHSSQLIQTGEEIEKVAIGYGFLMAGDGKPTVDNPSAHVSTSNITKGAGLVVIGVLLGSVLLGSGCASVAPGSDPVIVRTEQVESNYLNSIELILKLDDGNRTFWKTNAPAFHQFAEWLRVPTASGTNTLPRSIALVASLDAVKLDYKAGRASSNQVYTLIATVEGATSQAGIWATNLGVIK